MIFIQYETRPRKDFVFFWDLGRGNLVTLKFYVLGFD